MAFLNLQTRCVLPCLVTALLCVPMTSGAVDLAGSADEYRVKAAFLLNFLKFVEWPEAAPGEPLVIGVLLPDHFDAELDAAARSARIVGRRVEVRRFRKLGDVRDCQILFVPREAEYTPAELPRAGRLTVGETPQFLSTGGIISFYLEDNRVRFEIDPKAAQQAGLRIDPNVLRLGARR